MDDWTCYCRNPKCVLYGQMAPQAWLRYRGWHRNATRFQCQACGALVSARTGTAYAGIRTEAHTYLLGATALAEGLSIRATGRLLDVDKGTVNPWRPVLGRHCQHVMPDFFRHVHLHECQLEELWTCISKKAAQLTPLEKLAEVYGDAWVWMAFSPMYTLVPAWVVGQRTWRHARRLVFRLQSATAGHIPCFTRDAWPHDANAWLDVYGVWVTPPRQGPRGRFPNPRRCPPPDVCDAVVVNKREHGRVVHVTTRLVYGTRAQVEAALQASPVSRVINTYGVERHTLTVRQHSRRMGRQVQAFSRAPDDLE